MKAILLIVFIFFLPGIAFTQSKKLLNEESIEMKHIYGKWRLTIISQRDTSITVPVNEANYLVYKGDGSYSDSSSRFKVTHGTWTYDSKTQFLYTNEVGGKSKVNVVRVTKDELILKLEVQGMAVTTIYKKVE
jgi:hypothetical protein